MLTADDWKLIVKAAIERTSSAGLEWSETDEGPENTRSFVASVDDATTLSIWGYRTGYSYQLDLVKQGPSEVAFEATKRATTKKNSEGVDFAGLFKAAQRHVLLAAEQAAKANRDMGFSFLMEYVKAFGDEATQAAMAGLHRLAELEPIADFSTEQWLHFIATVKERTDAAALTWTKDEESVDDVYEARMGALKIDLAASRASSSEPYTYYIGVESDGEWDVDGVVGYETDDERLDGRNRQFPAYSSLKGLHDTVSRPFHEQDAKFQKIVKDDVVHGILTSLKASRD